MTAQILPVRRCAGVRHSAPAHSCCECAGAPYRAHRTHTAQWRGQERKTLAHWILLHRPVGTSPLTLRGRAASGHNSTSPRKDRP